MNRPTLLSAISSGVGRHTTSGGTRRRLPTAHRAKT
jgi:hypothetical protein